MPTEKITGIVKPPARQLRFLPYKKPEDLSFAEAQRIKEIYLSKLRKLEFEIKSGRLVDLAAVEVEVFQMARRDIRDSLMNWPSRVAAMIVARFGVDHIELELCLNQHLSQLLAGWTDPGEESKVLRARALRNIDGAKYNGTTEIESRGA